MSRLDGKKRFSQDSDCANAAILPLKKTPIGKSEEVSLHSASASNATNVNYTIISITATTASGAVPLLEAPGAIKTNHKTH